jgi:AcrR family transcriptional regulator
MANTYSKRQMEILNITIDYISKNGIKSFSLRNIANAIGIKQPSLYDHFENKEQILRGIFDIYKSEVLSYHDDLAALKASKLTKIKMYFLKMCEFIQYKPDYMNLVWKELYQYRDLFRDDFDFLWHSMIKIADNATIDKEIKKNLNYVWLITLIQGALKVFLERKLISPEFDVLTNADIFWNNLDNLLKN